MFYFPGPVACLRHLDSNASRYQPKPQLAYGNRTPSESAPNCFYVAPECMRCRTSFAVYTYHIQLDEVLSGRRKSPFSSHHYTQPTYH